MKTVSDFKEYKILSASNGEKIEDWNGVILRRPDPQAMWETTFDSKRKLFNSLSRFNF